MDGILISSIGSVERSWTKWALLRSVDPALARETAHGRRAVETIAKLRPDLDNDAELTVIEDLEVADNDGLTILPGVLDILAALPANRWTVVTSATERLARVRMATAGIPVPEKLLTADKVNAASLIPSRFWLELRCWALLPQIAWSLRIRHLESRPGAPRAARW